MPISTVRAVIHQRGWIVMTVFTAIASGLVLLLGVESPMGQAIAGLSTLTAIIVLITMSFRMPAQSRVVWWLLTASALIVVVAEVVYITLEIQLGKVPPLPNISDVFYLSSYLFGFAALILLIRAINPSRDKEAWIDSGIITLAAGSFIAVFILGPILRDSTTDAEWAAVAVIYPLLDILVLGALLRLTVARKTGSKLPIMLITSSFFIYLVADLAYNSSVVHRGAEGNTPSWIAALYVLVKCTLAIAILTPGAAAITDPVSADFIDESNRKLRFGRITMLAAGASSVPLLIAFLAFQGGTDPMMKVIAIVAIFIVILVLLKIRVIVRTLEKQSEQLTRQARTDALTGLPNRRTWDFHLSRLEERNTDSDTPLVLALLDLDHFKQYNDTQGHQAADYLLTECAEAWRDALPTDGCFIARYGGEEFVISLTGDVAATAEETLQQVRLATPGGQTVSIGYAAKAGTEPLVDVLARADQAMYHAKRNGRNQVAEYSQVLSSLTSSR